MKSRLATCSALWLLCTILGVGFASPVHGDQGPATLVAPLYPGAKTMSDIQNCAPTSEYRGSPCAQYSTDAIDKITAFYDKKIGGKHFIENTSNDGKITHWAPLAWYYYRGEDGVGDTFAGVMLHAKQLPSWPADARSAKKWLQGLRHFDMLADAVDWSNGSFPNGQGLRSIEQLKKLYAKYGYLETRYFADENAVQALRDKYLKIIEPRLQTAEKLRIKEEEQAEAAQQNDMEQFKLDSQGMVNKGLQGGGPEAEADRKEMEALMSRKPALQAKVKPYSDRGMKLMAEGRYDEAEPELTKANEILRSDPEVAALQDKQEARAAARSRNQGEMMMQRMQDIGSGKGQHAAQVKYNKTISDLLWDNWTAYLAGIAKLPSYRTEIIVDHANKGEGKEYSDRPDVVAAKVKSLNKEEVASIMGYSPVISSSGLNNQASSTSSASASSASNQEQEGKKKSAVDNAAETAKKAGMEGLKILKSIF